MCVFVFAGNVFPVTFEAVVRRIHRHLFHVLAHIYHAHFREIALLKLHPHLNTLFQHFITFNRKFCMVDEKETEVLEDLFVKLDGVIVVSSPTSQNQVPSPPASPAKGSSENSCAAPPSERNDINATNNGAVITCDETTTNEENAVPASSASTHLGDTGSGSPASAAAAVVVGDGAVIEEQPQRSPHRVPGAATSPSPSSSPSKHAAAAAENHHDHHHQHSNGPGPHDHNTSVPEQWRGRDANNSPSPVGGGGGGGGRTPQGGSTPLSSSPSKYPPCDVTTRQPQAQPQDPNLMPGILSS